MTLAPDFIWLLFCSALVFIMQTGFALCEMGFTRSLNDGTVATKRIICTAVSLPLFLLIGWGIMGFGAEARSVLVAASPVSGENMLNAARAVFLGLLCAVSVAIAAGATSERMKLSSAIAYTAVISAVVFPVAGRWIWFGWLKSLGFHDFAGGAAVHILGGAAALAGAVIIGPRTGKYSEDGSSRALPGHNMTLGAFGIFILWFGWLGATGGFAAMGFGGNLELIFANTLIAPSIACVTTSLYSLIRYRKPDTSIILNAALGGLAGISAGCDAISIWEAAVVGLLCGIALPLFIELLDRAGHVDDPTGAVGIHLVCGFIGVILTGLFHNESGLIHGGGAGLLCVQLLGALTAALFSGAAMAALMLILKRTSGIRVPQDEELHRLGAPAMAVAEPVQTGTADIDDAVPVVLKAHDTFSASDIKITKIDIVLNQSRFEAFKNAMSRIGVTGMTVSSVFGCGTQKGRTGIYRGVEYETNLLPKIKVEIVISKIPVSEVINTARQVLYTGNIGDGKIFVYDVENVVRVRTGEDGYSALQSEN